jgi:hypothetical protein
MVPAHCTTDDRCRKTKTVEWRFDLLHIAILDATLLNLTLPSNPIRLPANQRKLDFAVEVSGVETVREVKFATSMRELAGGTGNGGETKGMDQLLKAVLNAS